MKAEGKEKDIVMVNPRGLGPHGFPFGMAILAAILKRDNFSVAVVDANADQMTVSAAAQAVVEENPRIICFTGLWKHFMFIRELSQLLRQRLPHIKQVAGGWWAGPIPEIVLRETSVDYVIRGEADMTISDICRRLLSEASTSALNLPGLCYCDAQGQYQESKLSPLPTALDQLPLPAYELFKTDFYVWKASAYEFMRSPYYSRRYFVDRFGKKSIWKWCSMYSGRGCYGRCTFCGAAGLIRRNHSPRYVVDHIEKMQKEHKVDAFLFYESLTLSTLAWVKDFCREIIARKLNIVYYAQCRADFSYDEEALALLSQSGCYAVIVGFESGNDGMLKKMKKHITVERYYAMVNDFHRYGIAIYGSFILNMPGETEQSLSDTVNFVKRSRISRATCGFSSPYPRTALYEYARSKNFITDEYDLILKNPASNKGRDDFSTYIKLFNFNGLSPKKLHKAKSVIDRFDVANKFYYKNKLVYCLLRCMPFLTGLVSNIERAATYSPGFLARYVLRRFRNKVITRLRLS